jgi:hypothetical protein
VYTLHFVCVLLSLDILNPQNPFIQSDLFVLSTNQSNESISHTVGQPSSQPANQPINQSINQSIKQSVCPSSKLVTFVRLSSQFKCSFWQQ